MRSRTRGWTAGIAAGALLAAGCSQAAEPGPQDPPDVQEEAPDAGPELPLRFAEEPVARIETGPAMAPPVTVYGEHAWVANEAGMHLVDLHTGGILTRVEPQLPALYESWSADGPMTTEEEAAAVERSAGTRMVSRPFLAEDGAGEEIVVTVVPVSGKDGDPALELVVAQAPTGDVTGRFAFTPDWGSVGENSRFSGRVIDAQQGLAAVGITVSGSPRGVVVMDLETGEVAWERSDIAVMDGHDGVLIGVLSADEGYAVAGVSLAGGDEVWSYLAGEGPRLSPMRPWFLVDEKRGPDGIRVTDIATGDTVLDQGDGLTEDTDCSAAATVMVCVTPDQQTTGYDIASGQALWTLPAGEADDAGAWTGRITATHEDQLYVDRRDAHAVLDARTGETLTAQSGVAPDMASATVGLVMNGTHVDIHPALTE
ncbi:PQQ-binding-like beta-propeller repeat protein [Streptomyces xiamenensis]|uniref:outer membrane protein assembly factor BamB family protein n=1 Tax=Streptomyces xiamenensis TaxID=408015 RepID=UPI0036E4D1D6